MIMRRFATGRASWISAVVALSFALSLLAACADMQNRPKETGGTLVGAGLGALAGSQIGSGRGTLAAVAIGTLAGAWMGMEVGKSLDRADRMYAQQTAQNSLENSPSGTTSSWRNPDSGHAGTFTPQQAYKSSDGADCRPFTSTVTIDGKEQTAHGTACRQPDGSWRIVG